VSFTNVIGVQSTTSDSLNESPLFSIRTKRAINQEKIEPFIFNYLGKKEGIKLQFPLRDNRALMIQKTIDVIKKMDEKEFIRFQNLIIAHPYDDKNMNTTNLIFILKQIRSKTKEINIYLLDEKNGNKKILRTSACMTVPDIMHTCQLNLDCILVVILIMFSVIADVIIWHIEDLLQAFTILSCHTSYTDMYHMK